jgi:acetyltransferase
VDKNTLGHILVTLGDLGCAYPDIREIDINPLIIYKGNPIAVDGLVVLA